MRGGSRLSSTMPMVCTPTGRRSASTRTSSAGTGLYTFLSDLLCDCEATERSPAGGHGGEVGTAAAHPDQQVVGRGHQGNLGVEVGPVGPPLAPGEEAVTG